MFLRWGYQFFLKPIFFHFDPKIYLSNRPIAESLKVFYLGKELPAGQRAAGGYWIYDFDANAVLFHDLEFAKGDTEKVVVQYLEK
jgi:hypothetical protein